MRRTVLALLVCAALPAIASDLEPTTFRFDASQPRDVIVEFNEPPLVVARTSPRPHAAADTLDSLAARLARDIDGIEGRGRGSVMALSPDRAVLRRTYRMAFAGASVRVTSAAIPKIRALPYVRAVHEDRPVEAYLQSSVPHIRVPEVRAKYGRRGDGIVVAIIDTGVNYAHKALGEGFGPGFKVIGGYDFVNDDADPMDDYGHGTHVAGIVAGDAAPVLGVAPAATLLAYKVLDDEGRGDTSDVIAAVERVVDPNGDGDPSDRADVANMSLGAGRVGDDPLVRAVEYASAAGVVFCVAAGNTYAPGTIGTPGAAPSAITVGATDAQDAAALFTSRGPIGGTWSVKPEVAAPGVNILSAFEDRTTRASGTSMATPHVAGVVALLLEEHPTWTVDDIKSVLISTAKPVLVKESGAVDVLSAGGGRIDALAAFEATIFPSPATVSFGIVPKRGQPFLSTAKVKLANRGASPETLTARPSSLREGVTLIVSPETVTLAPGTTAEVTLTLDFADTVTPEFTEAPIALTGMVELTGTHSQLHVPWVVVTGDVISATYGGTDEYSMYISRGAVMANMWPEGPRTWGAFVNQTLGADVMVLSQTAPEEPLRVVIRERKIVEGLTPVTLLPEEATLDLAVAGVDERGVSLGDVVPFDFHAVWHEFTLPSLGLVKLIYTGASRSIRINPQKETRIRTYETLFSGSSRYFGAYPSLRRGIDSSRTLTIAPGDWARQRIHHTCRTECRASVGAGVYASQSWEFFPLPSGAGTWDLHLTPPSPLDTSEADFRAHVLVREKDFKFYDDAPWTHLSPPFRNIDGRMAASTFGRITTGDYRSPSSDTAVPLGDGPVVVRLTMGPGILSVTPYAPLGETLGENVFKVRMTRTKLDGGTAKIRSNPTPAVFLVNSDPGLYQVVVTDEYEVAGRPGHMTLSARHDNRLHTAAPALSMMRVENAWGGVTSTVPAGSQPRLVFAGRLSAYDKIGLNVDYEVVDPTATRVWWRRHGTSEWLPLPVTMTGEDNAWAGREPGAPGILFATPLAAAAQEQGAIDLRIDLGDSYGGSSETVYEPAFVVVPPVHRRRAMR